MSTQSISARLGNLPRQYRIRQSRHRFANKRTRRSIAAPESLECRRLLASDVGFGAGDVPGDEPFPDTFTVAGVVWEDVNANGVRDGEPGLVDVGIYSDLNRNGRHDDGEPWTSSTEEIGPDGVVRNGVYELSGLDPGIHVIRQLVPDGFIQTFPPSFDPIFPAGGGQEDPFATVQPELLRIEDMEPLFTEVALTVHPFCIVPIEVDVRGSHPGLLVMNEGGPQLNGCGGDTSVFEVTIFNLSPDNPASAVEFIDLSGGQVIASIPVVGQGSTSGAHIVEGFPGEYLGGIDFGNHREQPLASVHGLKWLDRDGDGQRDEDEPGVPGVTIFADTNGNRHPDFFEPATVTMEDGRYWLDGLPPGTHVIRELVPDGFRQTFPGLSVHVGETELGRYHPGVAMDLFPSGGEAKPVGDRIDLALDITAVWPDSCGTLAAEDTSHTVVGSHILVELYGHQKGDACAEVISPETTTVSIEGLQQREYTVVATLHEELRDGSDVPTLAAVSFVGIGQRRGHRIELGPGESIDGINFGNQPLPPGQVHGTKWLDDNGNGQRDDNERGLAGITIFSDTNLNGQFDEGEPHAVTMEDDPSTADVDEGGRYWLEGLKPGPHWIKEIIPEGLRQTFPQVFFFDFTGEQVAGGWHDIWLEPGQTIEGIDFGNQRIVPGSIHGRKWNDANGNGEIDDDEPGVPGVTIYVDLNFSGELDEDEPHAVTMESGSYWLEDIHPGQVIVREVVPDGFVQTFPGPDWIGPPIPTDPWFGFPIGPDGQPIGPDGEPIDINGVPPEDGQIPFDLWIPPFPGGGHFVFVDNGQTVEGINFGNREAVPGSVHGVKWLDENGNRQRDDGEPGMAEVTIYADQNNNFVLDEGELHTVTMDDDLETPDIDETGRYWLKGLEPGLYYIREVVPDGFVQTFPEALPRPVPFDPEGNIDPDLPLGDGAHVVFIQGDGAAIDGLNFGNRLFVPAQVHGTKWHDLNGNGQRESNEPGLPGVTIYVDLNFNRMFDPDEPYTETMEDGRYWIEGLDPGGHVIREVVPDGFVQTFPPPIFFFDQPIGEDGIPFPEPYPDDEGGHFVFLEVGDVVEGIDFGNREIGASSIHGRKWRDDNGNGRPDDREPGLPGVTIYIDVNENGVLDEGEPHTVTMEDIPETDFDEAGLYWLDNLDPGRHVVREVVPDGFEQTFPRGSGVEVLHVFSAPIEPLVVFEFGLDQSTTGNVGPNGLTFVVTMGACADRLPHETEFEIIDHHISVNMFVDSTNHEVACDAGIDTFTQTIDLGPLEPGDYELRAVMHEIATGGDLVESFLLEATLFVESTNAHIVHLSPNQGVDGINFGNRPTNRTAIHGLKWLDRNGNAERDPDEPGLPGVTIYVDINNNGRFDDDDPHAVSNNEGRYWMIGVEPGLYDIREVVPDGFVQTFPHPEEGGAHTLKIEAGRVFDGIDFGNRRVEGELGSIHGIKWLDENGNGRRDVGEPGLGGVVIYLDLNWNERFDVGEPHTETMHGSDDQNVATGTYWMDGIEPGFYLVREVVPDGFVQTFPEVLLCEAVFCSGRAHIVNLEPGQTIDGIGFGNRPIDTELGALHGRKWLDRNGNGRRDDDEPGMPGVTILLAGADGIVRETGTMEDDPTTPGDETGLYWFDGVEPGMYAVMEVVPDGFRQTFPAELPPICHLIDLLPGSPFCTGPQHLVSVEPGQVIDGLDFGNQPTDTAAGSISGRAWLDENANGRREDGEPGLAHITVFIDINLNGVFDADDLTTVTMEDDPNTEFNELGFYRFTGLDAGFYVVRELVPDIYQDTFPELLTCRAIFCNGRGHLVELERGDSVRGLNFGNAPAETEFASVHGTKWLDRNGDGERQDDEPGLPGVIVYSDVNFNGQFDPDEPHARTMRDNPHTDFDESGMYWIEGLEPGEHLIEEVVPSGFEKTFPISHSLAPWPISEPYFMILEPGQVFAGADFGNHPLAGSADVVGFKWLDRDGDGKRDEDEPGLGGVTIFWDADNDGRLGPHEMSTVTSFDNPATSQNEAGRYRLNLPAGEHRITEVVPDGFVATFPSSPAIVETFEIPRVPFRAHGYELTSVEMVEVNADGATVELTFSTIWPDSCGGLVDDATRVEVDDSGRIHVEMLGVQTGDFCLQVITTDSASIVVPGLQPGEHHVRAELHEETREGTLRLSWVVEAVFTVGAAGTHVVELQDGDIVDGVNFGNRPLEQPTEMIWDGAAPVGTAGDGSDWDDERNWSQNGEADVPPGENMLGADIVFAPGHGGIVDLGQNQDRVVHSLRFLDDYALVGDNVSLDVTAGEVFVADGVSASITAFVHSSNGEFRKSGPGRLMLLGGGDAVTVIEGVLGGSSYVHQLSVGGMGTVAPGASAGTMEVGSAIFDSGATLEIEIGDGGHDRLVAESAVFLAGQLAVELMDDFSIVQRGMSETITILEASLIEGRFDEPTSAQRHLGNGTFYDIVPQPTRVDLRLLTAIPGDANGDGRVDGIDLTIWSDNRFGAGDWTQGDFTGDGLVDGSDFGLWNQFKFTGTELALAPVMRLASGPPRAALNEHAAIVLDSEYEVAGAPLKSVPSDVARQPSDAAARVPAHTHATAKSRSDWAFYKARQPRDRSLFAPVDDASAAENWDVLVDDLFAQLGAR